MNKILLIAIVLAICMTFATAKTFQAPQLKTKSSGKCELCKFIVAEVQKELGNHPVNVQGIVDKVCKIFPESVAPVCDSMMSQVINNVIELLKDGKTADKVCELIKVCDKTAFLGRLSAEDATKLFLSLNKNFNSNGTCAMCKMIIQKAEDLIHDNEDEVEKKLLGVCKLLPDTSLEQMCDTIVVLYGPQIIDYILTHGDADKLCHSIGLCKDKMVIPTPPVDAKNGGCPLCTYVVGVVEDYIKDDRTQKKIEEALGKVCDLLPAGFADQCKALVNTYEPQLIEFLTQKYSPKQICALIGVCESKMTPIVAPVEAKNGGCALCTYVVGVVEDYIKDDRTQKKIEEALDNVCDLLPGGFADQCKALVKTYESQLIEFLTQKYTPKQICTMIGVCESKVAPVVAPVEAKNGGCALCTYVLGVVEDYIKDDRTQKKIEEALDKVCNLLPGGFKDQCTALVKTYEPQLIEFLTQKYTPKQICTMIGVCDSATTPRPRVKLIKNDSVCGLCKLVVGYVEQYIGDKKNEKQIEAALEKICGFLPGQFANQCDLLVESFLPQIIDLIVNGYPADKVCKVLHLCDEATIMKIESAMAA